VYKFKKTFKNPLTMEEESDRIYELSPKRALRKKLEKNLKKVLKKVLTKGRQCDIIVKSPRERRRKTERERSRNGH